MDLLVFAGWKSRTTIIKTQKMKIENGSVSGVSQPIGVWVLRQITYQIMEIALETK